MVKYLKPLRVLFSLLFITAITFAFIDFKQILSPSQIKAIVWLQFLPSLLKFMNIASISALGFIVILLLTLLFGRVYCSSICPWGVLQDVISFIARKFRKKKKMFRYSKPYNWLRYGVLGLCILAFIFGFLTLFTLLDPYSNYGRFASDMLRPVYISLNNLGALLLDKANIELLYPFDRAHVGWQVYIVPALMLGLLLWLTISRGRLFCNTLCPVGAMLSLCSKISLFKIRMDESKCTRCGKCSMVCKAECIKVVEKKVNFDRCVACYNCLKACPESAMKYTLSFRFKPEIKAEKKVKLQNSTSRREFMAQSLIYAAGLASLPAIASANSTESKTIKKKYPVSPPGSQSHEYFNFNCTACHLCVSACPTKVLQPSFLEYGIGGMLQPRLDFSANFCNYECTVCSDVCPTQAIRKIDSKQKKTTQIGVVHFVKENCIVPTENTSCGACAEHCPTSAVHMVPYKDSLTIPETTTQICIGCGACEHACPARPNKAIYVDGNPVHQKASLPTVKKQEEVKMEDFPF
jgi:ferredoxin